MSAGYILLTMVIIGLAIVIIYFENKRRMGIVESRAQERKKEYGTSGWCDEDDFEKANHNDVTKRAPGIWLGEGYSRTKDGSLLAVSPPGGGKGAALIIPNLLLAPFGSYVVTDPKGEIACITARAQSTILQQQVYILDPWDEQKGARHGIPASGFNPFDMLRMDLDELPDNCEMIARYLVASNPNQTQNNQSYWEDRARSLIKMLLVYIVAELPIEEQNFWTLYKLLRLSPDDLGILTDKMRHSTAYEGLIAIAANEIYANIMAPETFGAIMSHAHQGTAIFESPKLRASLLKSDFNPFDLPNGNVTLYIVIPERYLQSHAAWLKIVVGLCLKAVNARPNKRVNFLIDEAAMLGGNFKEEISRAYAYGRGQNICMWTFWQSLAQLKDIYGEAAMHDLIGKSKVFQAFGLQDYYSQKIVSDMLGDETRERWRQGNPGQWEAFNHPLMTPEEVGKEPGIITIVDSCKMKLKRSFYFNYFHEGMRDIFNKHADDCSRGNA